jgi:nucleotide-binding universal stress UspA family protein
MNYRSLLVLLDQDAHCPARTMAAIRLAKERDCHLVGLAPTDLAELPDMPKSAASMSEYAAMVWDALRDQAERAADTFREECRRAGVRSFEAVIDECDKTHSLIRHARCSDLALVSQADPSSANHRVARHLVEHLVIGSARPTLILPCSGYLETIGTDVMVAWDESREASRAVSDALPLLRYAKRVRIVSWNERGAVPSTELQSGLDALRQWLMWQGVNAAVSVRSATADIASTVISQAADWHVDLIVMGAYGHSRWSESVLGGATRGLLTSMTVPVLMSH